MGNYSTSPLRRAINSAENGKLRSVLEDAGEDAADLINNDMTSDCIFRPFLPNTRPPLHTVIFKQQYHMVDTLLEYGADVNAEGPFGETAVHIVARQGRINLLDTLIKAGADLYAKDASGRWALHTAVHPILEPKASPVLQQEMMQYLLEQAGTRSDVNRVDYSGNAALHLAAKDGNLPAVEYLLQQGADVRQENKAGLTPGNMAHKRVRHLFSE